MKNHFRFTIQLLAMLLPASLSAKVIKSQEYNGYIYDSGYESDFQVDGIFYTIHENGVYVSAQKFLYDPKKILEPYEVAMNSSYQGVITIPETVMYNGTVYNVTGIDNAAFKGCVNLDKVNIPNSVIHIGFSAFKECSNLKDISLPPLLTVIETGVFRYCSNLEYVSFPKNLKKIGAVSFAGCSKLKHLYVPDTVERIDTLAFDNCTGLTLVSIPSSVSEIGIAPFQKCRNIDSIFWYTPYVSPDIVTAWCGANALKYILLGNEMTKIEPVTFWGCVHLTSITIPEKIEYIDYFAFMGCHNLRKIVIEGHPIIYENVFSNCWNIDSIVFKSSTPPTLGYRRNPPVYGIEDKLFDLPSYEITTLSIPEGSFDEYAASDIWSRFYSLYDNGYESDFEDDSIFYTYHEGGVSAGAKAIKRNSFKDSFGYDGPLTPRDPTAGGFQPRSQTRNIETATGSMDYTPYRGNIVIPESVLVNDTIYAVTGINYYAFIGCNEIESVYIPESVNNLGYGSFAGCSGLKEVNIPSCITRIPNALFYGCSSLSSVNIPTGVTTIGYSAFCGCTDLTEIIIPAEVKLIDQYAFAYCSNLKRVIIKGDPIIDETAFLGCGTDLEVLYTKVEAHKAENPNSDMDGAIHYGIDGRRIQADTPGLHLIKRKDGTVVKALVR